MLERILKTIRSEKPDRLPVIPFVMQYAAKIAGVNYRDYCKDGHAMAKSQLKCIREFGYDAANVSSDAHRLADALGGKLDFPKNDVPRVVEEPIQSEEDLKQATVPDPREAERCAERLRAIERIKEEAPEIPVIGWIEGALSDASSVHGVKETLVDFKKNEDFLEELFDFVREFDLEFARAQVEAGADIVGAGDSLASQVSDSDFKKSMKYTREIFEEIDAPALYHVCGDTTHQLENLKSSGADIVDLDWQVDLEQARKEFGQEICIRGNINPSLLVSKDPDEIEDLCLQAIEKAGKNGSFILSAGCEIPPDTERENLEAMIRVARGYTYN